MDKTKKQLINELETLHRRIAELEEIKGQGKRVKDKLQESEAGFKDILDNIPEWIWKVNAKGKYIYTNRVVEKILGYKSGEILKKHFYELFHPEDKKKLKKMALEIFAKKQPFYEFVNRGVRKDGKIIWLSTSGVPILDKKGNLLGYKGVDTDITEYKWLEGRRSTLIAGLRAVTTAADELIACPDVEILFRRAVELVKDKFGLERCAIFVEEDGYMRGIYGTDRHGHITDEHAQRFPKNKNWMKYLQMMRSQDPRWAVIEEPYLEWNGKKTVQIGKGWIVFTPIQSTRKPIGVFVNDTAISGAALNSVNQDILAVFCSLLGNIIERKWAEQALRESEHKLGGILSSVTDHIKMIDSEYNIIWVNDVERRLFGKKLIGKKCYSVYCRGNKVCSSCAVKRTFANGKIHEHEMEIIGLDGKKMTVWCTANVAARYKDGRPKMVVEISRDITERKQTEKELGRLNKELSKSNKKLKQLALRDPHTGLYNYRYLEDIIEVEFLRAKRYAQSLSVIMLDIDYFKSINDVYGHQFGDLILKQLASQLKKIVRRYDTVIRFGGEEFVVISPRTDRLTVLNLARRLLDTLRIYSFGIKNSVVKLKVSIAVASYPEDAAIKSMDLVGIVDQILNKAKEDGGDRVYSSLDMARKKPSNSLKKNEKTNEVKALRGKIDRLTKRANQSLIEAVFAFAKTIKLKDHYTGEHVESTVYYATEIARALDLPREEIERVRQAAVLHDLGKIGISEKILLKKSKFTHKEFEVIKKHPQIAADIIRPIKFLHSIIPLIIYHHERWDGKGYPRGLKGEEIPVGARIIAIADVYQALISNRPYRKAYTQTKAVKIIKKNSGIQFDPRIVKIFLKVI